MTRDRDRFVSTLVAIAGVCTGVSAQTVDPYYAGNYSIVSLGAPTGVPTPYGGVNFLSNDPNTMLLGGNANGVGGAIYRVSVVRDGSGNITGFNGTATIHSTAPNIDGGLTQAPGNVLMYTGYPIHTLGQIKPGSTAPDKVISLSTLGMNSSVGSVVYVPAFAPGGGKVKFLAYNGGWWYSAVLSPDGLGTFDILSVINPIGQVGNGPEGIVYIPTTSALFSTPSLLLSEYGAGRVSSYNVDSNGDPIAATRKDFITGLSGVEGAVLDPVTGQFIFSTYGGGNQVIVVRGFAPPPPCYPNCDGSTSVPILNASDFTCFLNQFAAGQSYANCDGSTTAPILNVNDFVCFLNRFGGGC